MTDAASLLLSVCALLGGAVAVVLALVDLRRRPEPGHGWFIAVIVTFVAAAVPFEPFGYDYAASDNGYSWRFAVVLLVLLPASVLHLVATLVGHARTRLTVAFDACTVALVAHMLASPTMPGPEHVDAPWWFAVTLYGVFALFIASIVSSVVLLLRSRRHATGTARLRGTTLAIALGVFGVAFIAWFVSPGATLDRFMSAISLLAMFMVGLGVRGPQRMYELLARGRTDPYVAIEGLVASPHVRAELPAVLATTASEWGLAALAAVDAHGSPIEIVGSCPITSSAARVARPVHVRGSSATVGLVAWTTSLTPPLRRRDREQLVLLAHLIELAFAREATRQREQALDVASRDAAEQLAHAREQLRAAQALRARATRTVATDLRGPVNALLGLADAAEARWSELPPDQLAPLQQLVARQVARLATVVEQLLVVSSIEDGALRSRPEVVDVRQLVASVVDGGVPAEVTWGCEAGEACCEVRAEPLALREILEQLLENAATHGAPRIEVRVQPEGEDVLLEVLDEGSGVRTEFVPALFDRFTRDSPDARRGLGLGLAIVHELAESIGGTVGYRRDHHTDRTIFWLRLPRTVGAAA